MKIIAGTTHLELARNIANQLKAEFIKAEVYRFNDGELSVTITSDLSTDEVVIIQSICSPASDNLFELLSLIDIAKRAKAKDIIVVIPYFGYSRSDSSIRLIANLLVSAGACKIITVDIHSTEVQNFFKIPIINLSAADLFMPLIKTKPHVVIVSPDLGGVARAKKISDSLECELAIIAKERTSPNLCRMTELIGDVKDKHCVIIDDILDTAGTLCKAAEFLILHKAGSLEAYITHPVLSNGAGAMVETSKLKHVCVTNTITHNKLPFKFSQIPIDSLIIAALKDLVQSIL